MVDFFNLVLIDNSKASIFFLFIAQDHCRLYNECIHNLYYRVVTNHTIIHVQHILIETGATRDKLFFHPWSGDHLSLKIDEYLEAYTKIKVDSF